MASEVLVVDRPALMAILTSSRALKLLTIVLVALLLWVLSGTTWQVAALFREVRLPDAGRTVATAQSSSGPQYNVQALLGVPLFGVAPKTGGASTGQNNEPLRESQLKIKVLGVVAGSVETGVAVLQYGRKTRAYKVGEQIEVPGTVTLQAVNGDHIVIENNRRREKIELDKKTAVSGITASKERTSRGAEVVNVNTPEIRALVGDPRDTLQNSPLRLARFFAASPVTENGQVTGYRIKPGRDPRLFEQLELREGDILLSINGQSLSDVTTQELLRMVENTTSYEIMIKRSDEILTRRMEL
ncbi:type II secretion system protein GspC [Spongiibacter nanhainus]|uniref:Type II secretion system protein GspC n=1 Tax=Spongiibacter nanhainus TaxID=2794344 RepID=A0A7T4QY72_9GAMM|nr:type II secretion system protein GspC [Spongiibacter nanhainus]QQD16916.1 type II secretion system protein GspC [Spongiibacter nanhainus]